MACGKDFCLHKGFLSGFLDAIGGDVIETSDVQYMGMSFGEVLIFISWQDVFLPESEFFRWECYTSDMGDVSILNVVSEQQQCYMGRKW